MKNLLLETWKIKSIEHESHHEKNMIETLEYVNKIAKKKGIIIPRHRYYKSTENNLERLFILEFNDMEHQNEWFNTIRDDSFNKYVEQWEELTKNFKMDNWNISWASK